MESLVACDRYLGIREPAVDACTGIDTDQCLGWPVSVYGGTKFNREPDTDKIFPHFDV